jgi:glycosyltransferase involved in cell wall biosynthesis
MKKCTILIPCYNEEASLPILFEELYKLIDKHSDYNWELLFINDGSKDQTLEIIKEQAAKKDIIKFVDLSRNFGKENAMLAGFDYADGDCVVILDADLQHPPPIISEMVKYWEEGFDDVYAKRLDRDDQGLLRKYFSELFYLFITKYSDIEIPKNVGDFRLLDIKCILELRRFRENQRYTKGMFSFIGFKKKEILYTPNIRIEGKSSWSFTSLFKLAVNGITSFSVFPLKMAVLIGLLFSFISFVYLVVVVFKTIFFGDPVRGYPTLVSLITLLGGIQLFFLGIIGEYIGKSYMEVKNRPVYIVRETNKLN